MKRLACPSCKKPNSIEDYDGFLAPESICSDCELKLWEEIGKMVI